MKNIQSNYVPPKVESVPIRMDCNILVTSGKEPESLTNYDAFEDDDLDF